MHKLNYKKCFAYFFFKRCETSNPESVLNERHYLYLKKSTKLQDSWVLSFQVWVLSLSFLFWGVRFEFSAAGFLSFQVWVFRFEFSGLSFQPQDFWVKKKNLKHKNVSVNNGGEKSCSETTPRFLCLFCEVSLRIQVIHLAERVLFLSQFVFSWAWCPGRARRRVAWRVAAGSRCCSSCCCDLAASRKPAAEDRSRPAARAGTATGNTTGRAANPAASGHSRSCPSRAKKTGRPCRTTGSAPNC